MSEDVKTEEAPQLEGKMAEFVDWIETISVLELSKLVKALEVRLGVSAAAPVAAAAAPAAGGDAPAAEEQTEFDVVLTGAGSQKIQVIKELRAITGAGLKEAKEMSEASNPVVKAGVSKAEADEIKAKLEGAGASVEIK
ncbi:MAG: 50S ribosomal protein L7/L12 [Kiritimatiellae bacterium]|nr:50S ribosomal protein L7/L12 [Kiritimatiellia bacterium]